jgi:hypothetical protein
MTLLAALPLVASGEAQEQRIAHTIVIDASPEAVWAVRRLRRPADWYPLIEASWLVLGENEVGCIRELTRRNGTKVEEKLIDYDPWNRSLTYTYAGGLPMSSDYFATLTVSDAAGGKSLVEWKARFKRLAYWTDDPPPGQDDATVTKALNAGYKRARKPEKVVEAGHVRALAAAPSRPVASPLRSLPSVKERLGRFPIELAQRIASTCMPMT